jgi:hypothetical protein
MKSKPDIEKLVDQALDSIGNVQPVDANEFLYAKVVNRIRASEIQERVAHKKLMLKLSFALGVFICINVLSFYAIEKHDHKHVPIKKQATGVAAFAEEYSLKNSSYSY